MTKNVTCFKVVKHHSYSWSYIYKIDGKKRSIAGSSLENLKKQVLNMGLPWDYENYPDDKITKTDYDDGERRPIKRYRPIREGDFGDTYDDTRLFRYSKSMRKH